MSVNCPKCASENTYHDGNVNICPMCGNEWADGETGSKMASEDTTSASQTVKDANGNLLVDGDTVVLIKDLKVKGASSQLKSGTKIRSIKIQDEIDGHNLSCRISGIGAINLKSEFVKKIQD